MKLIGESYYFKSLRLYYDLFSKFYDSFTTSLPNYLNVCNLVTHLADPSKDECALDVASGTGLVSIPLAEKVGEVVCLDASLGQLRQLKIKATSRILNINLVMGDARILPFRDNIFNIVTCSGALSEIPNKKQVIEEMQRVLKHDGRLVIMTMNSESIPLLYLWAYNTEKLKQDLEKYKLKKIRIIKIKPFYLIAKSEKQTNLKTMITNKENI